MSDERRPQLGQSGYMPTPEQYIDALGGQTPPPKPAPAKRPHGRRRWKRVVVIVLLVLLVIVIGYVGYIGSNVAKITTQPLDFTGLTTDGHGRTNILVLGEGDPGHAGENLTDTMMVFSYDAGSKRVAQISVPRDLRVNIPGYGSGKINSANADGGTKLAQQVVSNTLGIPINYVVQTNFSGLKDVVDAVGGLDVNVTDRLVDTEYPCDNDQYKVCGLDIEPGLQHMDGTRVLQYTRCRKGTCGNDFGRAERQQQVLDLLRQKLVKWQTLADPRKLVPITAALHSTLTTDLGSVQLLEFGLDWQRAQKNNPIHLVLSTSNYLVSAGGSSDLVPTKGSFAAIQERIQNIFTDPLQTTDNPSQ